jgi:hypothetical protein
LFTKCIKKKYARSEQQIKKGEDISMSLLNKKKVQATKGRKKNVKILIKNNWQLYVLILPAIIYFFVFVDFARNLC